MIQLIVYGILAAVLIGGAYAVRNSIEEKGAQRQAAIDKPIIESCKADVAAKTTHIGALEANETKLKADREAQNAAIDQLGKATTNALAERDKALAFTAGKTAILQRDRDQMRAELAQKPQAGVTCEQSLSSIDRTLRELAARRVRDHPPAAGSGNEGGNVAAPAGASTGAVRISP